MSEGTTKAAVTRIARRRARTGHAREYEQLVREIFARMCPHAEREPEHRRLSATDEWFLGPDVPSRTVIPRWKTAVVTWLGIWPLSSLVLWLIAPIWQDLGLPFLVSTAIDVVIIVLGMVLLVSPVLTKAMKWFLVPSPNRGD